ncbi:MAG: hypothetical protein GF350_04010, partial [Chitinivibrionales bacterium]|nr:hypothetical protein [Chitinivibrionales bacterium]
MNQKKNIIPALILIAVFSIGFHSTTNDIVDAVNIYLYDTLFFISDAVNGIHVYSIRDRASPRHEITIPVIDNSGLAVKENIIYANSGSSLLAIKLLDNASYEVVSIIHNKYNYDDNDFFMGDDIVYGGWGCVGCAGPTSPGDLAAPGAASGTGGSYAIFSVIDTFLYYID